MLYRKNWSIFELNIVKSVTNDLLANVFFAEKNLTHILSDTPPPLLPLRNRDNEVLVWKPDVLNIH